MIVGEFSMGDVIGPRFWVVATEDPGIRFYFLIYLLSFSVCLRMVGGGEGEVIFQESFKFSSEGGCKLRASVRDDFVVEAEAEVLLRLDTPNIILMDLVISFFSFLSY